MFSYTSYTVACCTTCPTDVYEYASYLGIGTGIWIYDTLTHLWLGPELRLEKPDRHGAPAFALTMAEYELTFAELHLNMSIPHKAMTSPSDWQMRPMHTSPICKACLFRLHPDRHPRRPQSVRGCRDPERRKMVVRSRGRIWMCGSGPLLLSLQLHRNRPATDLPDASQFACFHVLLVHVVRQ